MSSYPTPPSLNSSSQPNTSASSHPSLPARPPAPNNPLPAAPPSYKNSSGAGRGYAPAVGFKPRSVAGPNTSSAAWQQSYPPTVSAGPAPPASYSAPSTTYNSEAAYSQGQYAPQPSLNYYQQQSTASPALPSLQNPFPAQGRGAGRGFGQDYDPELEAQIAQWQSAYISKDDANSKSGSGGNANYTPLGGRPSGNIDVGNATAPSTGVAAVVAGADGKQKTVVRSGGGKSWQDSSLLEWDPSHPRLFVGNLAGEVTDDSLLKAFSRYPTVERARVIRDKRTSKSKGYGFVSFSSSDDYFQAAKEMQGKYIGSHPVLIKRSTTEIKASVPQPKGKGGKGSGGGYNLGANTGAGINKKSKKKGGLKLLG